MITMKEGGSAIGGDCAEVQVEGIRESNALRQLDMAFLYTTANPSSAVAIRIRRTSSGFHASGSRAERYLAHPGYPDRAQITPGDRKARCILRSILSIPAGSATIWRLVAPANLHRRYHHLNESIAQFVLPCSGRQSRRRPSRKVNAECVHRMKPMKGGIGEAVQIVTRTRRLCN